MNNTDADQLIIKCDAELHKISLIINGLGPLSNVVPFLTQYSAIKSCGTIEQTFKMIIADYCSNTNSVQANNYIEKKFRNSSMNPSYDNICRSLNEFDEQWNIDFKNKVKQITNYNKLLRSLKSINEARNEFAHGGTPTITFTDVCDYFNDSKMIITCLDSVVI